MKRAVALIILIFIIMISPTITKSETSADILRMFDEHGAVMLVIDPETGSILYANSAAISFYGYTKEQLLSMEISQINMLTSEEVEKEMEMAASEHRNYFLFEHKLKNGEIRSVEVFSYPVQYGEREALYSIIHDITEKVLLEEKEDRMITMIIVTGSIVIAILTLLLILIVRNHRKLKISKKKIDSFNELSQTFIDANKDLMYLKDENLKYIFINKAVEAFYKKKAQDIIGHGDYDLTEEEFARKREKTDLAVLEKESLVIDEVIWDGRIYETRKFPVRMLNERYGVGAYIRDVTEEREIEEKQKRTLCRYKILTDIFIHSFNDSQEQLDYILNEAIKLTESKFGYMFLYDEEKEEFNLMFYSGDVMKECGITEAKSKYNLKDTGLWREVVRQRKPIVINDFEKPNPLKKGYPKGHVILKKFMSVPVIIDDKVVAVVGLANKEKDYDSNDVYEIGLLMNGVWNIAERKKAQERLAIERNKYLQILISIGDGVMVVDKNGYIEMLNNAAERLTGWSCAEVYGKHYKEVFKISHEQEGMEINDPIEDVLATDDIQILANHAILTSKDGTKYSLEDSAAPIKDEMNQTIGVVLVFRDVTDKKQQRQKIEYLSYRDTLTGVYNRRYLEERIKSIDIVENLPLSVIMADVNDLKLTNDIFGHAYGDILLTKVADAFKRVCRKEDIIVRWGGDEFLLLLPKTSFEDVEEVINRVKQELLDEKVKAIKCSVSMGADTKENAGDNILDIIKRAEERMYLTKTIERNNSKNCVIENIISTLHEGSYREKDHAFRVRDLCQKMGRALNLSEVEIRKLKTAGFLHDIGKIVMVPELLNKKDNFTSQERNELNKHPLVGFRILNSAVNTLDLAEIVLAHHERWDGTGYPKGLKGEEIPLLARIISIAESYDRMVNGYHDSAVISKDEAIQALRENAGIQFDPNLTELFIDLIKNE
jgi:diguanylate cyclase (GGDEF)-like protein/PAS domain S-box-containing protein